MYWWHCSAVFFVFNGHIITYLSFQTIILQSKTKIKRRNSIWISAKNFIFLILCVVYSAQCPYSEYTQWTHCLNFNEPLFATFRLRQRNDWCEHISDGIVKIHCVNCKSEMARFICDICGKAYNREYNLSCHIMEVHCKKKRCKYCHKNMRSPSLKRHKKYSCPVRKNVLKSKKEEKEQAKREEEIKKRTNRAVRT